MHISKSHAKFSPGAVAATPGVLASVSSHEIDAALQRHFIGDWGDLTQGDRLAHKRGGSARWWKTAIELPLSGWCEILDHHRGRQIQHHCPSA